MTEIAFVTDFVTDGTGARPYRARPTGSPAVPPVALAPVGSPFVASPRRGAGRRLVESTIGTAFSLAVTAAMVTGLAGAGTASAVAAAASALRSR
ncbi:hypothetical protein OED52_12000 [Rhodococcus sp. Z13]|uniref:Uncharacterized protein n=1 Tax=Rhodococcus sacchari TaxID=2962047 RepID=A0ACD4DCP1_9NOCA|nr:hypothetical protein [Rhodococcus sp. Z13]UYP17428.1 hypothetical protein OED52_12000 [Rhodococcus sp. Z13]